MSGRVVVITGASSGIGLATATRLAAQGERLVVSGRREESLQRAAAACAGAAAVETFTCDVSSRQEVDALVEYAVQRFGRVDAVVHSATSMAYGAIDELPPDIFDTVVDVAIQGTANLARSVLPVFRGQQRGTFVVVNSLLGSVTVPFMGAYATAKWGQRAVARTLQQELRGARGIHVCIVSPGSTNTPIYAQAANYTGHGARPPAPVVQPERTARAIAGLLDHPRNHVSIPVGPTNPVIVAGFRLLPLVYDVLVTPLFKMLARTGPAAASTGNVLEPTPAGDALHGRWPADEPS